MRLFLNPENRAYLREMAAEFGASPGQLREELGQLAGLGNLEEAYIIDDYAQGRDTGLIDLVLLGDIDHSNLHDLVTKTERYLNRKIRVVVFEAGERGQCKSLISHHPSLKLWSAN